MLEDGLKWPSSHMPPRGRAEKSPRRKGKQTRVQRASERSKTQDIVVGYLFTRAFMQRYSRRRLTQRNATTCFCFRPDALADAGPPQLKSEQPSFLHVAKRGTQAWYDIIREGPETTEE